MSMTDEDLRRVATLISSERLATFLAITGTERDALELHQHALEVGAALMPVTGLIEVALRNAIAERLRELFDVQNWLNAPPAPFEWRGPEQASLKRAIKQGQRAEYAKLTNAEKKSLEEVAYPDGVPGGLSHEDRVKARQRAINITTGQQIAQLTLHFWKRLFSGEYEAALWSRSLKRLFPNKALSRSEVASRLETIYQARNRIAHHEPLHGRRLSECLAAIDFIAENFEAVRPSKDAILAKMIGDCRVRLQAEADALDALLDRFKVT